MIISKMNDNCEYIQDIDLIVTKLQKLYKDSMLEHNIHGNNNIINCFLKGGYRFNWREEFSVQTLKLFLNWFKIQPIERKKIIMNHIWKRFDNITRIVTESNIDITSNEDLPF